ncbi:hypothetical protein N7532_010182 [Penicillium argentinense]|uniref:Phosphoglycerate mutase family protein n=1 Tax=Penicillium argentinense TaxID=1131581 RepID=A0A9W9JXV9_9EURO|nr:uncharacterized protein N7532_010182 [Penicillium argentinense]KAJ5085411.1 hypothetical protein N7532_010182 [Penicillium argentinense]
MLLRSALLFFSIWTTVAFAKEYPTAYLIRHGEKPANPDDHDLTLDGVRRAQCLRTVFGAKSKYNISHIMAPTVKWNGEHGRALKTVLPLATDLGLEVDTHCSRKKAECVADAIRSFEGPGNLLIAWRHKNIPDIQEFLGSTDPLVYPDDRFDMIWTIPYPYDKITDIRSEECPGLDTRPGLVAQY